jgi:hypothetical protein
MAGDKSLFENWPFGRASLLASPDFQRFPEIFGLARTLALPGLAFQTASMGIRCGKLIHYFGEAGKPVAA